MLRLSRGHLTVVFLTHLLWFWFPVSDTVCFLKEAHLKFVVTALRRHFSVKGWPQGSCGEACAYLSVFNHSLGGGWLQLTCKRHIIMLWWWVAHWCKADNSVNHNTYIRHLFDTCSILHFAVQQLHACIQHFFSCWVTLKWNVNVFQALAPNALYSVFFLVDKETVAKPERDINVQVNKDSYYEMDIRYFKLTDLFMSLNARPKEI